MTAIRGFELLALDLPFRKPFKHAAADRVSSESLFLTCHLEGGATGYGESLPRRYVTGETRDGAFELLREQVLPRLLGRSFGSLPEVIAFLQQCNGKAPEGWVAPANRQTAAWAAVDLALLDAFGKQFSTPVRLSSDSEWPESLSYSVVTSSDRGWSAVRRYAKIRIFGIPQVKLKVDADRPLDAIRSARRILGRGCELRIDANMAWSSGAARQVLRPAAELGVVSCEQPVPAGDLEGLAALTRAGIMDIMVDESLHDGESMRALITARACTAVNVRVSKCGGLVASLARCREALAQGWTVQIGCQVGESSLLSAAQMILILAVQKVRFAEGCFGRLLLREDPAVPLLQFGYGGRPPATPTGAGLGIAVEEDVLKRHASRSAIIGAV